MKKFRKLIAVIAIAVMCISMTAPAMASTNTPTGTTSVAYKIAASTANTANKTVKALVATAQRTRIDDAYICEANCNNIMNIAKATIKILGYEVECSYDVYVIDGHEVVIDPIKVITPIGSGNGNGSNN